MDVFFQMPSFVTILDFVGTFAFAISGIPVSYTHLTLPTKLEV